MSENTARNVIHEDDLDDEALDERHGGKVCATAFCMCK